MLATDALIPNGGELTPLSQDPLSSLSGFLPSHWSHANPIDILGDADPELYEKAVRIAISDPSSDGLLVILAPQGMTNPAEVARRLAPYAQGHGKPVLASWMGGQTVAEGEAILARMEVGWISHWQRVMKKLPAQDRKVLAELLDEFKDAMVKDMEEQAGQD